MDTPVNGNVSFWYADGGVPASRPPLPGHVQADVCIVGAGFSGLWTAYYLKRSRPDLRVVVVEQRFSGFGASGRNGGWLSGTIPGLRRRYAAARGPRAVAAMQQAMNATVDEVISVAAAEGIQADISKGGAIQVACAPGQRDRLRAAVAEEHRWGNTDVTELSADQTRARINVAGTQGGAVNPHCAVIQPAKLVRGLAHAVERLGVPIYEDTTVTEIIPHRAITRRGDVSAQFVIRATEGFTAGLKGMRRAWLPMNSSIIVTQPLPTELWQHIGWRGRETLGDTAHAYMYAQRTADGRIALGGRGVPYRFGSMTDRDGQTRQWTIKVLRDILLRMFPALRDVRIAHAWSGVLAVPRDWCATVAVDPATGLGWAGGYVGDGVAASNLAGRTLRDLVLGRQTELVTMPWVGRTVRPWEPEPLRWAGVQAVYAAYRLADRRERTRVRGTSRLATVADVVAGRHER